MRITFATLSIACLLSMGCGGTDDTATTTTDTPAVESPDASSTTTTVESNETIDPADIQLVKLELPGMV